MGWQPGSGSGAGTPPVRDPRLAWFASDAEGKDALVPSGVFALAADEVSGPERRCPGAGDDELIGLLRGWAAIESWAAAGRLGVIAELIRRDDQPRPDGGRHGDLPDEWSPSLRHELALALACSVQSAQTGAWLAWELKARLPGIGSLLGDGTLTMAKARAVIETFQYLADADAASAEALILGRLAGKTYPQVLRLAERAALTVDPELAERRREQAQRRNARVTVFREPSGTAGLSGRDLPPDEALAAMAGVNDRARQYADSAAFGDLRMDVLRAYAFTDLLRGVPAEERIARAEAQDEDAEIAEALAWANARAAGSAGHGQAGHAGDPVTEPAGDDRPHDNDEPSVGGDNVGDDRDDDDGGDDHPGDGGPGPGSDPGPVPGSSPSGRAAQPRLPDLVVPLLTLLGLAERPGEIQGFGMLDPALARKLAATAVTIPRTEVCVTVTGAEGYAIGHGCARWERRPRAVRRPGTRGASLPGSPARLNLTVPARVLAGLAGIHGGMSSGGADTGTFAPCSGAGPPSGIGPRDGYGTWVLTLPDGRRLKVRLETVPVECCDHRHESSGYQPSARLRHLVQVRDGTCTFPSCNRHAR